MSSVVFKQKNFQYTSNGNHLPVSKIKVGDILLKKNGSLFWIDDIEYFYVNDEVGELHKQKPKHIKYTFHGGKSDSDIHNEITEIPHDAKFYVFRHYSRKDMKKLK